MKKVMKKKTEKYLTEKKFGVFEDRFNKFENRFDSSARATAKSFADTAEVMALILKEISSIHEENKYFRQSISSLNTDGVSYDKRISGLDVRVEKLESKM
jgi:hypothetical protein